MNTTQAKESVRVAEAELARLQQAATAAESEAAKARANFEHDPSEQAATTSLVATQRAKNARAQAHRYEQNELAQARAALKEAERQAVKASLQAAENALTRKLDGAVDTLLKAIEQFDSVREEATAFAAARKVAAQSDVRSAYSLESALRVHQDRLNDELGIRRPSPSIMSSPESPISFSIEGGPTNSIRLKVLCGLPVGGKATPTGNDNAFNDEGTARFDA